MRRPYHWQIKTNYGMQDSIGADAEDAVKNLLRSERICNPSHVCIVVFEDSIKRGRIVDYDYYQKLINREEYTKKLSTIASLCKDSTQVIKVAEAVGININDALGHWVFSENPKKI